MVGAQVFLLGVSIRISTILRFLGVACDDERVENGDDFPFPIRRGSGLDGLIVGVDGGEVLLATLLAFSALGSLSRRKSLKNTVDSEGLGPGGDSTCSLILLYLSFFLGGVPNALASEDDDDENDGGGGVGYAL